jgi:hypothetical protein
MLLHHAQTREELVLVATAVCTHPAIGRTTPLTALRTDEPRPRDLRSSHDPNSRQQKCVQ